MNIIGITGGIGTGKSTVLRMLETDFHAFVIEADKVAHDLMLPDQPVYNLIKDTFSEEALYSELFFPDRTINRATLSKIVFSDSNKLALLNAIVHPAVKDYILFQIKLQSEKEVRLFVIEAALLIEDGYKEICDELWYIYSSEDTRIKRLMTGRGYTREHCESVINNQSSDEFYRMNCDHIIDNSMDEKSTRKQLEELLKMHE